MLKPLSLSTISLIRPAALAITLSFFCSAGSQAEPWFLHHFGELRAYHGDWLAVCEDSGRGNYRTVQIVLRPGATGTFFSQSHLVLKRLSNGDYSIDVYDEGMPSQEIGPIVFTFDRTKIELKPTQWRSGTATSKNHAETLTITDPVLSRDFFSRIKAGRWLTVSYKGGDATFSLRGATGSLSAIETHRRNRKQ